MENIVLVVFTEERNLIFYDVIWKEPVRGELRFSYWGKTVNRRMTASFNMANILGFSHGKALIETPPG